MKRLALTFLALLCGTLLFAQQNNEHYAQEYRRIYQAYQDNPGNVINLMDIAAFYFDANNPMHSLALAYKYVARAEDNYLTLASGSNYYKALSALLEHHITIDSVRHLRQRIEQHTIDYVTHFPTISDGKLATLANAFRGSTEVVRHSDQRRLTDHYKAAQKAHTLQGYHKFVERYNGSDQAIEAQRQMAKLADSMFQHATTYEAVDDMLKGYESYDGIVRKADKRKASLAYATALEQHTQEAYRTFLSRYPYADEYNDALDQMERLLASEIASLRTPRELADFAHEHSNSPLAEEAMARLRRLVGMEQSQAAARIYFAEFPDDPGYGNLYREFYLRIANEGNADPILRFQEEYPNFPYMASTHEDLRQARRRDSIDLLRPYSETVFLDFASDLRRIDDKAIAFVALQRTLQAHIARKDWPACNERMDYFLLSFDELCVEQFAALRALINAPANPKMVPVSVLAPSYSILNAALHPNGQHLYYTQQQGDKCFISVALRNGVKKGVWKNLGAVRFDNLENKNLRFYSLYDNGRKMLLGQNGDILIAEYEGTAWHVVEHPSYPVNTDHEDYDAFMLPDGSGMLLASDRLDGHNYQHSRAYFHGDTALASDIYFIPRSLHGWGEPVNLGLKVNTPYCDHAPLLSSDLKTLYFISDGHTGLGYGDLFYCTRTDINDWTSWSAPINYGKETNTGFDEAAIAFSPDERSLYLCSKRTGRYALYSVATQHESNTKMVEVQVAASSATLVDVIDMGQQSVITQLTLPADGEPARITLAQDKAYAIQPHTDILRFVASEVFVPQSNASVELREFTPNHTPSSPQSLPIILFEEGSDLLTPLSERELDNMAAYLVNHTDISKVYLTVNTPGTDDQACFNLSHARALSLKRALEKRGVASTRIIITALGNVNYQSGTPKAEVEFVW